MNCSSHAVLQSGSQFPVYLPASMVGSQESGLLPCGQNLLPLVDHYSHMHASCLITVECYLPGGPELYNLV